jgi:IS4 transposase
MSKALTTNKYFVTVFVITIILGSVTFNNLPGPTTASGTQTVNGELFNFTDYRALTHEEIAIYNFLTNLFDIDVEEALQYYKKRWDIEVFFRFLKQELNFSHITSTSPNGIAVMMYMTMITAMMVLIYKKLNNIGYKTAVRRFSLELNELIIKMIVKHCGGDPSLVFR